MPEGVLFFGISCVRSLPDITACTTGQTMSSMLWMIKWEYYLVIWEKPAIVLCWNHLCCASQWCQIKEQGGKGEEIDARVPSIVILMGSHNAVMWESIAISKTDIENSAWYCCSLSVVLEQILSFNTGAMWYQIAPHCNVVARRISFDEVICRSNVNIVFLSNGEVVAWFSSFWIYTASLSSVILLINLIKGTRENRYEQWGCFVAKKAIEMENAKFFCTQNTFVMIPVFIKGLNG